MQQLRRYTAMASILLAVAILSTSSAAAAADHHAGAVPPANATCRHAEMPAKLAMLCWKAIFEVPFCAFEIAKVYDGGSVFGIGKPCCMAFVDLTDDCKIEVVRCSEVYPVIEGFCKALIGAAPIGGGGAVPATPPAPRRGGGGHHHHRH